MALEQNVESQFSGNDVLLTIAVTDDDNSDAPLDLSGAQALIWALAKNATGIAIITKTLGAGVEITDAVNGEVEVTLTAADLEPLKGDYYHEMRLTTAAGKKVTLMYGSFTIVPNLIRD